MKLKLRNPVEAAKHREYSRAYYIKRKGKLG